MIVITGATGALNGGTVEHLLDRLPAGEIGVSVRDPDKARHFADRGVRVRQGSYDDPTSLRHSFEDADQVLLVSSSDMHADQPTLHRRAIEIAAEAGASRILYTGHQNARADSAFFPAGVHAAAEADLAASGVAWTSLRNGFYAHSLDWLLGPWQATGVIAAPADGPVSWTDRADQAEAAAVILAGAHGHDGPVTLTASTAPTFAEIAAVATTITGRQVERVVADDEEWVAQAPEPQMARMLLGMFLAARVGDFAQVDPTLATLLGREPRTVADLLADRAAA
ncbi:NAD(P)H-binding protein [uncultured Jatrophihabitans sp.]|uniref:NmrA family NAD(P)-binding protein n=1 Tax=uncultured Jatrophihabitans sp. TaxID=1610747 RepID=UPI0035CAFB23